MTGYAYEVVKRAGKWRAREYVVMPDRRSLLTTQSFDDFEDALLESAQQHRRRRASLTIGFR